ncbi:hypothetical protein [Tengunoibacter tsumagoiensis]|uniref:PhoU domain-containing protein n=1 Tax=Tengunoibacter tsumagoiensis TaxID=2014871 RepID=A0A402A6Q4_9CHLR|nr:hypothetical protein [Tengunoibacter tsumagoiensis]GCE14814.1 hypothetical protein KTT_46730 [Tengunoibacter tsumagoiensis]
MVNPQHRQIALQASGEYLMNHLEGVMEMVQDTSAFHQAGRLDEQALESIEAQIKALAEELAQQSHEQLAAVPLRNKARPESRAVERGRN